MLPNRIVMEPLYHLACVTRSLGDRRRAARAYDAARPGLVAVGGGPMNATLYVARALRDPASARDAARRHRRDPRGPARDRPTGRRAAGRRTARRRRPRSTRHVPVDPLEAQGYLADAASRRGRPTDGSRQRHPRPRRDHEHRPGADPSRGRRRRPGPRRRPADPRRARPRPGLVGPHAAAVRHPGGAPAASSRSSSPCPTARRSLRRRGRPAERAGPAVRRRRHGRAVGRDAVGPLRARTPGSGPPHLVVCTPTHRRGRRAALHRQLHRRRPGSCCATHRRRSW